MEEHGQVLFIGMDSLILFTFASFDDDIRILSLRGGPTGATALNPLLEYLRVVDVFRGAVSLSLWAISRQLAL